jgi:hypothetical protein
MSKTYRTHHREEKYVKKEILGNYEGKKLLTRPRLRREILLEYKYIKCDENVWTGNI